VNLNLYSKLALNHESGDQLGTFGEIILDKKLLPVPALEPQFCVGENKLTIPGIT
jgi:hypothetical protein